MLGSIVYYVAPFFSFGPQFVIVMNWFFDFCGSYEGRFGVPIIEQRKRIVHIHVPKTAGTSLRNALQAALTDKSRLFPHYDEKQFANVDLSQYDVYSGHIGFDTAIKLDGALVSVLRDPVDRFLSVYYFWRQLAKSNVENSVNTRLASKYELSDFVTLTDVPSLIEEFQNRVTWQIASGFSLAHRVKMREHGMSDLAIFEKAKNNVPTFSVLGIQEDLVDLEKKISATLGLTIKIPRTNVTDGRMPRDKIPYSVLRKIEEWVFLDIYLYNYVKGFGK